MKRLFGLWIAPVMALAMGAAAQQPQAASHRSSRAGAAAC